MIEVSPLHPEKAPLPILVTLLGILIEVSPLQPEKVLLPILVTLFGILIEVSDVQPSKTPLSSELKLLLPIESNPWDRFTEARLVQL